MNEEKGVPFRKAKEKARYLLEDFSDDDCRVFLYQLVSEMQDTQLLEAICRYWEEFLEYHAEVKQEITGVPDG